MRRRIALPTLLLTTLALGAPATGHAATYGFSEQQPQMFSDPLYQNLKKVKVARYIAPYDVATDARDKAIFESWLAAARADKVRVLVSFYYDRDHPLKVPSKAKYEKAMKAFAKLYKKSDVPDISPYNEANRDARKQGRFAGPSAKQAAGFYLAARKVFKGRTIVGLDVLDQNNVSSTIKYIKKFQAYTRSHPNKTWGLHNYSDTNRNSSKRTKAVLRAVRGSVWLTETGGLVALGKSFPYNEARAAKAL
jgi:hypothetical protein